MPRIARVSVPSVPHHITQRGNRRQKTFFSNKDYAIYIDLMAEWCNRCGVEIWAYCLMPNHVHLIAVPDKEYSLAKAIGEAHRRYTRHINFRKGWRGHLWQGRFASYPMDENYLMVAVRYVELNPVKARLVSKPELWKYSSAASHVYGKEDALLSRTLLLNEMIDDWKEFLSSTTSEQDIKMLQQHERTGRPLGSDGFLTRLEKSIGRLLKPKRPGRKPKKGKK
jgi:putative transposase